MSFVFSAVIIENNEDHVYSNYLIFAPLLGEKVPQDAQDHKNELNRITKYIMDLQEKVKKECDAFSEVSFFNFHSCNQVCHRYGNFLNVLNVQDVKYWAEYKTGIKEFTPWLNNAEKSSNDGLAKPTDLE